MIEVVDEKRQLDVLDYETPPLKHWVALRVPRSLCFVDDFMLGASLFCVFYGIVIMSIGWVFRQGGIVFVRTSPRRKRKPL